MKREIDHAATSILNEHEDEGDLCARIKVTELLGDLVEAIIGMLLVMRRCGLMVNEV